MRVFNSEELLSILGIDKNLVIEFFIFFSRFEYALKKAGYIDGNSKRVWANWEEFANEIEKFFDAKKNEELEEAVNYLLTNPPRKQILKDGKLSWKDNKQSKKESDTEYLLRLVRTVRNNLFHGGKFPELLTYDHERDEKLLLSSLVLLNKCLELKQNLKNHFFEGF